MKYKLKKDVLWYKAGTIFERDSEGQTYVTELDGTRYRTLDALQNAICDHRDEEGSEKYFEKVLAQKEDKKECKHIPDREVGLNIWSCKKCHCFFVHKSTPSPLEIEEIEEIHKDKNITVNFATKRDLALAIMKTQLKTNSLIRNQKKLYQYIKEKKL